MIDRGSTGDDQHVRREGQCPCEHQLGGCDTQSGGLLDDLASSEDGVRTRRSEPERPERYERDLPPCAFFEYRLRGTVRDVKEVLDALNSRDLQGVAQVRVRDVAETDRI